MGLGKGSGELRNYWGMMANGWWHYAPDRPKAPSDPSSSVYTYHSGVPTA